MFHKLNPLRLISEIAKKNKENSFRSGYLGSIYQRKLSNSGWEYWKFLVEMGKKLRHIFTSTEQINIYTGRIRYACINMTHISYLSQYVSSVTVSFFILLSVYVLKFSIKEKQVYRIFFFLTVEKCFYFALYIFSLTVRIDCFSSLPCFVSKICMWLIIL